MPSRYAFRMFRPYFHRLVALAVPVSLAVGACGGSESSGSTSGPPDACAKVSCIPLADVPAQVAGAACNAASTCLGPLFATLLNASSCESQLTKSIQQGDFSLVPDAVAAGTVQYDASKLSTCLDAIRNSGCGFLGTRLSVLCADALHGTVKAGSSCTFNGQCAPGLFCQMTQCPGVCTSLYAQGHACTTDDECMSGLQCDDNGTCAPISSFQVTGAINAACDPAAAQFCQTGLVCALTSLSPAQWKCEQPATGSTCHLAIPEGCPSGQYCKLGSGSVDGTCTALPAVGSACADRFPNDTNPVCPIDSVCSMGTCKAYASLGSPCAANEECYSKVCKSGTCAATQCSP